MADSTENNQELEIYLLPLQVPQGTSSLSEDQIRQALYSSLANYNPSQPMVVGSATSNELYKVSSRGIQLGHSDFDSAPFSVSMTGALVASNATISGSITASTGAIGGFTIGTDYIRDAANSMGLASTVSGGDDVRFWAGAAFADRATAPFRVTESGVMSLGQSGSNPYIVLDGVNNRIGTSNYSSGSAGWRINGDGSAEFMDITTRGTIRTSVFEKDTVSAVGGQLLVTAADVLDADMTALDASTMTTAGNTTFATNSILHLKDDTYEEYMRVVSRVGNVYTVTRDLASAYAANSNPAWKSGTAVVKEGVSDGSSTYSGGWLRLLGEGTNSPRYSVFKRTGLGYSAVTEYVGLGNLNGLLDYASDEYGIAIGTTSAYMSYDPTNGLRIYGAASVNGSQLGFQDLYGDGHDGTATITSDTSFSRDMFYDTLTIGDGSTACYVNTNGYRLHVKTLLTIKNNAVLGRKGNAGSNGTDGGNGSTGGPTGGTPGTGGAGGSALADGSLKGALAGCAGGNGGSGQGCSGSNTRPGNNGSNGTAGSTLAKSLTGNPGKAGIAGGGTSSGNAGSAFNGSTQIVHSGDGGSGGAAGGTPTGTVYNLPYTAFAAWLLQDFFPSLDALKVGASSGGAGGGAGAGSRSTSGGGSVANGGGGGGGGSGSVGGLCAVYAKSIVIQSGGKISVIGGAGGNGGNAGQSVVSGGATGAATGGSSGGSGGNGGDGGVLILVYSSLTNSGSLEYTGGAGGTGGSGAAGAGAGSAETTGPWGYYSGQSGTNGSTGYTGTLISLVV